MLHSDTDILNDEFQRQITRENWHSEECKLMPTYNTNLYTKKKE